MGISEQLEEVLKFESDAYAKAQAAEDARVDISALRMQCQLLLVAEKFPEVTSFSFNAEYAYDDEGGYFWSSSINAFVQGVELDWDHPINEALEEVLSDEAPTIKAFSAYSWDDGEITIDQLRLALGVTSASQNARMDRDRP